MPIVPKVKTHATSALELAGYFVTPEEARCHGESGGPCRWCGGKIYLSFRVLRCFKVLRERYGKALRINSAYRCRKHELQLWEQELARCGGDAKRAAKLKAPPTGNGPHEKGEALDVHRPDEFTQLQWGQYILDACKGDVRIGCQGYTSFAHMDTLHKVRKGLTTGIRW